MTVTASDGYLKGIASSTVRLAWPVGASTRPPTLTFRSPMVDMLEDGSILLSPTRVRFGDGRSLVDARVQCSAGDFTLGNEVEEGGGGVVLVDGGTGGNTVALRGLPKDVASAFSLMSFKPPKNWSSRAKGVVTLTMDVEASANENVRKRTCDIESATACSHNVRPL